MKEWRRSRACSRFWLSRRTLRRGISPHFLKSLRRRGWITRASVSACSLFSFWDLWSAFFPFLARASINCWLPSPGRNFTGIRPSAFGPLHESCARKGVTCFVGGHSFHAPVAAGSRRATTQAGRATPQRDSATRRRDPSFFLWIPQLHRRSIGAVAGVRRIRHHSARHYAEWGPLSVARARR